MAVQSSTIIIIHLYCTNTSPYSTTNQANIVLHDQYHHWLSIVNSFHAKHRYCCDLLARLEQQRHCCYLSRLLPQHSAPFTAQSFQAESVINFSHRGHSLRWNHCPFPKKAQSSPSSPSSTSSCVKRAVISWEMHDKLSTARSAWQPEPKKYTMWSACDSTSFPIVFLYLLMRSKRACNIRLGS